MSNEAVMPDLDTLPRDEREFAAEILKTLRKAVRIAPLKRVAIASAALQKTLSASTREGKLAQALARGLTVREKISSEEGGSISADEAARYLGTSKQSVLNLYHGKKLLGWRTEKQGAIRFPVWQFTDRERLAGLSEVLAVLEGPGVLDDWGKIGFFLQTHDTLDNRRPIDLLREKQLERVLKTAAQYVE